MNRQQRRAEARRPRLELSGFRFGVTPDEAAIIEEALAMWVHQTQLDLPDDRLPRQTWALERGERLRQGFEAAIAGRPWRDIAPNRIEPEEN